MDIYEQLKNYANSKPNEEVCGLIYLANGIQKFYPCESVSKNKQEQFKLNPYDYVRASELGKIILVFHSHIDNKDFTLFDYQQARGHNLDYLMFDVKSQTFNYMDRKNHPYNKFIGLEFEQETSDCFSLIVRFYKEILNIDIPGFFPNRKLVFEDIQKSVIKSTKYLELIKKSEFTVILDKTPRNFDVLLFNFDQKIHFGIFIAPNFILHQESNKRSSLDEYSSVYSNHLICIARKT